MRRVVTGEVESVLEAETVRLRVGDRVVQRRAWHSWGNACHESCVIAGLMVEKAG